jgi:DNA invertase Pin-like site-specific DNA recombinase
MGHQEFKIKMQQLAQDMHFEEAQKNKFFIRNLEILSSLLEKNRKIKRSEAKKIILLSLNQYFKFPKPRNVIKNFNIFQLFFYRVNRKYRKIKEYFSKNQLISRYDIYYFTQLNNNLYSKLTSNYKIKQELNILYNNVINPN